MRIEKDKPTLLAGLDHLAFGLAIAGRDLSLQQVGALLRSIRALAPGTLGVLAN